MAVGWRSRCRKSNNCGRSKQDGSGGDAWGGLNIMSWIKWGDHQISWLNPKSFILTSFFFPSASANLIKPYLRDEELELLELELEEEDGDLLLLCFLLLFFLTFKNFTFDACRSRKSLMKSWIAVFWIQLIFTVISFDTLDSCFSNGLTCGNSGTRHQPGDPLVYEACLQSTLSTYSFQSQYHAFLSLLL